MTYTFCIDVALCIVYIRSITHVTEHPMNPFFPPLFNVALYEATELVCLGLFWAGVAVLAVTFGGGQ